MRDGDIKSESVKKNEEKKSTSQLDEQKTRPIVEISVIKLKKRKVSKMKLKMYAIRDAKAEYFNTPFYAQTPGEAQRNFETLVNDKKSTVNQYPKDFDLYEVGEYDQDTGKLTPITPRQIVHAAQLVRQEQPGL